jgi:hypothetical protein
VTCSVVVIGNYFWKVAEETLGDLKIERFNKE